MNLCGDMNLYRMKRGSGSEGAEAKREKNANEA